MTGFHMKCNTGQKWVNFIATLSKYLAGRIHVCSENIMLAEPIFEH